MPTRDQLIGALRQADSAGEYDDARRLAEMIKSGQYSDAQPNEAPEQESIELKEIGSAPELNELSMGAFKSSLGLLTTGDTESLQGILKQSYGDRVSFKEVNGRPVASFESGDYELNKEGLSAQDIARSVFQFLEFTPAGKAASIPAAIGKNAMVQVANDSVEGVLGGEGVNLKETAISGGLGGGFKAAEQAIGTAYRATKGAIPQAAKETIKAADDAGVKILTSDAIPPKNFVSKNLQSTAEKVPLIGTGAVRETQEIARKNAVDSVLERYGEHSYEAVVNSLNSQKNRLKKAAGQVLSRIGSKLDSTGKVSLTNTEKAIQSSMQELNKTGVLKSSESVKELVELSDVLLNNPQTFTTLKENRTAFREIVKSLDKAERSQMGSRAKSLLNSVVAGMSKDMDEIAKSTLNGREFARWKRANAVYAEEAKKLTRTKLKNVLDKGDLTPEAVKTMLFSKAPSEVKMLYSSLTNEGRAHARSAIINSVAGTLSRRANGITPNSFVTEMKKQGLQIDTFFKGAEKKQLKGLLSALDATRRAGDASVATPTGQSLFTMLGIGAGSIAPTTTIATGGSISAIARAYESPVVRNALLKLGSLPRGSTRFESALNTLYAELNSIAQSQTSDTQ